FIPDAPRPLPPPPPPPPPRGAPCPCPAPPCKAARWFWRTQNRPWRTLSDPRKALEDPGVTLEDPGVTLEDPGMALEDSAMAAGRDPCGALLTWLQTFNPPGPCETPQDLCSGVTLAQVLHRIDPSWFHQSWLSRIRDEGGARNKVGIFEVFLGFFWIFGVFLGFWGSWGIWGDWEFWGLGGDFGADFGLSGADFGVSGGILGHIFGCQGIILGILGSLPPQSRHYYYLSQETPEEGGAGPGEGQRCRHLELQVAALLEDKAHLAAENRALRERLDDSEAAAKKLLRLQAQVEELQEENYRLESGREELRARCSHLEQEARGLQVRAEQLSSLEGEARALRQEMDLLRCAKTPAQVRLHTWTGVQELSDQQAEAELRAEKWHLELRHLQERFQALSQEKERLLQERDELREANEELRCAQVHQSYLSQTALQGGSAPPQNLAAEILPAELRETVTRLRRENRRLRLQRDQLRDRLEASPEPRTELNKVLLEEPPEDLDELPQEEEEEEEEPPRTGSGFGGPKGSTPQNPSGPPGGPPGTPPLAPVLRLLRNQLQEKDALIRHLERDCERSRAQREREERLLVTAWYNMGLALQHQDPPSPGGALSFLAQQRLVTVTRRARTPHGRTPPQKTPPSSIWAGPV
ncbi:hypothetical protein HGM15179_018946, partial [Zosterops borbonicus]